MIELREFQEADSAAVQQLYRRVFENAEGEEEGRLVSRLANDLIDTTDDEDVFGFVAAEEQTVVGAIFFSRLTYNVAFDVFLLSPVAVDSNVQGRGVGTSLIRHGLASLKNNQVKFVITYGDPAFYSRVGFNSLQPSKIKPPFKLSQPVGWLGQTLNGDPIDEIPGDCRSVSAFRDPAYW